MLCKGWTRFVVLLATAGTAAVGANFSFTGTFSQDDQLEIFKFTSTGGVAVLQTWGYAGGTNAGGQSISAGGFDPILSLFGPGATLVASTPLIAQNNDGAGVATDPATGFAFDSFLTASLSAGQTYFLVLSQFDNFANGPTFGGGFSEQGNGNFTPGAFGCGGTSFCDNGADQRNGNWSVDITGNVTAASDTTGAPEPRYTLFLGAAFLFGWCLKMRRFRQQS